MALLDMESFGLSSTVADFLDAGLFLGDSAGSLTVAGTPFGDPAMPISIFGAMARAFPATPHVILGVRVNAPIGSRLNVDFCDPSTGLTRVSLVLDTSFGVLRAFHDGSVAGASPSGAFVPGTWFYLEVAVTIDAAAGAIVARVNGAAVLGLTGINTVASSANPTVGQINLRNPPTTGIPVSVMHMYIADGTGPAPWNTFMGDVRVLALRPTGAGGSTQFAPNGGAANWQNAATFPPVPATDFNASATIGATDLFALPALPADITAVLGVQVQTLASRDTAGTRALANVLKSDAITATGAAANLGTAPTAIKAVFTLDPATGAAWTVAAVGAAQPGYTITA